MTLEKRSGRAYREAMSLWYHVSRTWLRMFLLPYWPTELEGAQHIPKTGPAILAGNHPTVLDGLVVGSTVPRRVYFLVFSEVMKLPLVGHFLRALRFVPVSRGNGCLDLALERLDRGDCLGIFPEAEPTHGLELRDFRRGVAVLAQKSGAPVIPFAIRGTEQLCRGDCSYISGGPVRLVFGDPLRPAPEESAEEFRDRLRAAVQALLDAPVKPRRVGGWAYRLCALVLVPMSWLGMKIADRRFKNQR